MDTAITWTPERIEQFVALWTEGISTAEMGRRPTLVTPEAGVVSKNAVIGKRVRMGLPERVHVVKKESLPPRNIFDFEGPVCMYPIGHPGDEGFHFCGGTLKPKKPYCSTHAALTYIPKDPDKGRVQRIERKEYYY